jgi:hypothetical protein
MSTSRIDSPTRSAEASLGRAPRRARRDAGRLAEALLALEPPSAHESFRPPRPGRAASVAAVLVFVAAMLGAFGILSWRAVILIATPVFALALLRVGFVWSDLWRSRSLADRLLGSNEVAPLSPLAAWRAEELTSPAARRRLRRLTRGLIRESKASLGPSLSPSEEAAVRDAIVLLQRLDARLGDLPYAVTPSGVLAVNSLVGGDRWSPLYYPERAADLVDAVGDALALL